MAAAIWKRLFERDKIWRQFKIFCLQMDKGKEKRPLMLFFGGSATRECQIRPKHFLDFNSLCP